MIIPNYSGYDLTEGVITNLKSNKIVTISGGRNSRYLKLKDDSGVWKSVSLANITALCYPPSVPEGFVPVPFFPGVFISKQAEVWHSPTKYYPLGYFSNYTVEEGKYPRVPVGGRPVEVHQLLARAFLMHNYIEEGLCVMHIDDDKTNLNLSNLVIGTYSENNKAAYDTGANLGRKINSTSAKLNKVPIV